MRHSFLLIVMITVSLEPKWRHFAQVNIADIFMLSSKLPKQNEIITFAKNDYSNQMRRQNDHKSKNCVNLDNM